MPNNCSRSYSVSTCLPAEDSLFYCYMIANLRRIFGQNLEKLIK